MFRIGTIVHVGAMALALSLVPGAGGRAQPASDPNGAPNPYRLDKDWLKFPDGRKLGQVNGVDIDPDGKSVWVFERCGKRDCVNSPLDPIKKFDAAGNFVTGFGRGIFNHPHGFAVDRAGNVWGTDNTGGGGKGHVVVKFSPQGKVLMTLGKPGVRGLGPRPVQCADRCRGRGQRRYHRQRWPRRRYQCPHRQIHQRRQVHRSVGQARFRSGRIRGQPFAGNRFRGPHLRGRPRQQPRRDI